MSKRTRRQTVQPLQWMNQPFTPHVPEYNAEIEAGPLRTGLIWLTATHPTSFCLVVMGVLGLAGIGTIIAAIAFSNWVFWLVTALLLLLALCFPALWVAFIRRLAGLPKPFVPPIWYRWSRGRQSRVMVEYAKPGARHKKRHSL